MARGYAGEVLSSEIISLERRPCLNMGKAIWCVALGVRAAYWPTESETLSMRRNSMSGSRESLGAAGAVPASVRLGKVCGRNPSMYATRQSDRFIVPKKPSNESLQPGTANGRRRRWREGD